MALNSPAFLHLFIEWSGSLQFTVGITSPSLPGASLAVTSLRWTSHRVPPLVTFVMTVGLLNTWAWFSRKEKAWCSVTKRALLYNSLISLNRQENTKDFPSAEQKILFEIPLVHIPLLFTVLIFETYSQKKYKEDAEKGMSYYETVLDTPEMQRVRENQKNFSLVSFY